MYNSRQYKILKRGSLQKNGYPLVFLLFVHFFILYPIDYKKRKLSFLPFLNHFSDVKCYNQYSEVHDDLIQGYMPESFADIIDLLSYYKRPKRVTIQLLETEEF